MEARITHRTKSSFKIEIEIPYGDNILDAEEKIQQALNLGGTLSTKEAMTQYDTDGNPILVDGQKLTSKGQESKKYQTPYGAVEVERHVYQPSGGGRIYVPLENGCRIIGTSTPKFAKMITSKYAVDAAPGVQRDLEDNHNRPVAQSFIKKVTDLVGTIAEAKEETWSYDLPPMPKSVKSIAVGLDGTCLNMKEGGWREAMCGTISFFDEYGERMHTVYTAASPEYGKETFLNRLERELKRATHQYPKVPIIGLADGAVSNWRFLLPRTNIQLIDFWHVTEYLSSAASVMFPGTAQSEERSAWLENACHRLKHKMGSASRILNELKNFDRSHNMNDKDRQVLRSVITYLTNNKNKMAYHKNVAKHMPIGSGVTESACKMLVKQRMCKGAAKWKDQGASVVLTLRSLHATQTRWDQFWDK